MYKMYSLQTMTAGIFYPCAENCSLYISVRRRGKNIDSSSKSNPLRRRGKITTRRREGVGVEENEESRRTFNKSSCDLLTGIKHTEIPVALYKTKKQFNIKAKL